MCSDTRMSFFFPYPKFLVNKFLTGLYYSRIEYQIPHPAHDHVRNSDTVLGTILRSNSNETYFGILMENVNKDGRG